MTLTKQEAFDKAFDYVLEYGFSLAPAAFDAPYAQGGGACLYRGANGAKCHVGALIPDNLYSPFMEGTSVCELMNEVAAIKELLGEDNRNFYQDLQLVHDCSGIGAAITEYNDLALPPEDRHTYYLINMLWFANEHNLECTL